MLSLTIASTRPRATRSAACENCSTFSTFAPASFATCDQLLVADCAVVRPFRSASVRMSEPFRATMTPRE